MITWYMITGRPAGRPYNSYPLADIDSFDPGDFLPQKAPTDLFKLLRSVTDEKPP